MPKEAPKNSETLYRLAVSMMLASSKPFAQDTLRQIIRTIGEDTCQEIDEVPGAIERRKKGLIVTERCAGDVIQGVCEKVQQLIGTPNVSEPKPKGKVESN
jgi:hypothetical protein